MNGLRKRRLGRASPEYWLANEPSGVYLLWLSLISGGTRGGSGRQTRCFASWKAPSGRVASLSAVARTAGSAAEQQPPPSCQLQEGAVCGWLAGWPAWRTYRRTPPSRVRLLWRRSAWPASQLNVAAELQRCKTLYGGSVWGGNVCRLWYRCCSLVYDVGPKYSIERWIWRGWAEIVEEVKSHTYCWRVSNNTSRSSWNAKYRAVMLNRYGLGLPVMFSGFVCLSVCVGVGKIIT